VEVKSDAGSQDHQRHDTTGMSEQDARALVEQLRSTPADQIVADVLSMVLDAARVKLGRRDARLFIDLCTVMVQYAGPYLSGELGKQVESALGQLRLGQVSAERRVATKGELEPNDLGRIPTPPPAGGQADRPSGASPASSKLWVPGH
jgi:hypothetical protein